MTGLCVINLTIGGNVIEKRKKDVPWWRVHQIAEELKGQVQQVTVVDSRGVETKRIIIDYKED